MKNIRKKIIFIQLGVMLLLQYMLFAVWWVPFAAYLHRLPDLGMNQIALIMSTMAIGSMASPLIGLLADRYFASEKLLAVLNLLVAFFLFLATQQAYFTGIMISITLVMLCYMPTWSLTSSIAMTHVSSEQFPRLRIAGSIGWVASGLFSMVAIHVFKAPVFDGTVYPLYCGAVAAVLTALFCLSLPHTPPTGNQSVKYSIIDILGLKVLSTLKDKNFNIFILFSFLAIIPFCLYHSYGSMFFDSENVKNITLTMNWGQLAEIFFLFITTAILIKFGFKKTLIFGLLAMLVRYLSLYMGVELGQPWMYSIGILTHGLIFGLFFVVGQVYTDKIVPSELRAQAQGFLFFVIWGVGYLVATLFNGQMIKIFRVEERADWSLLFATASGITLIVILLFVIFFKNQKKHQT